MTKKLAVLASFSGAGGVERMMLNLINEFAKQLPELDLLLLKASSPHLQSLPDNVRVIQLKSKHSLLAIPDIKRYLIENNPDAILVAKDRAGRAALIARYFAKVKCKIVVRLGTNLSEALKHKSGLARWFRTAPMRKIYKSVDAIVAVSDGVKQDTIAITQLPVSKVSVIRNPVITDNLQAAANEPIPHLWLQEKTQPVVMGVGRLSTQKDFATLIKAFAQLRQTKLARLIILGEGGLRQELEELTHNLGISEHVLMPGFQSNPHAWMSRANVFVLSSRWEGSPNVLSEALALGIPSVATRCPSGPNEVLQEGKYGPLIEMGDHRTLTTEIAKLLESPPDAEFIRGSVAEYQAHKSANQYLSLLLGSKG